MVGVRNNSGVQISARIMNNPGDSGDESWFNIYNGNTEHWNRNPQNMVTVEVQIQGNYLRFRVGGGDTLFIDPTGIAFCNGQRIHPF